MVEIGRGCQVGVPVINLAGQNTSRTVAGQGGYVLTASVPSNFFIIVRFVFPPRVASAWGGKFPCEHLILVELHDLLHSHVYRVCCIFLCYDFLHKYVRGFI